MTNLRAGSPAELLAVIPYLLGFHPRDSLVIVALLGPRVVFTVRADLPPPGGPGHAGQLALTIAQHRPDRVVLAGYGPSGRVLAALEPLVAAFADAGIEVFDQLRVEDGRYWSLPRDRAGRGRKCLPADSVLAAEATFAGMVALSGRADLVAGLEPVTGAERRAMDRAEMRVLAALDGGGWRGRAFERYLVRTGRAAVRAAEERHRAGGRLTDDEVARLALVLEHAAVRDYAWNRTGVAAWELALWSDLVRRAGPAQAAAPASLLAFVAWRSGQAALAAVAVARALDADPGYPMARLMDRILTTAVPPTALSDWPDVPMKGPGVTWLYEAGRAR